MAVAIDVVKSDLEHLSVRIHLTGLTPGTRYDVMRLQFRYLGDDEDPPHNPIYERELPDRRGLWSTVAHRVGWEAPATAATFRDFECPRRPTRYFVVPSASVGPTDWDFSDGNYPLSRGVLDTETVHFNRDLRIALHHGPHEEGHLLVRSTHDLGRYATCCVVDMDQLRYTARGTELAVLGSQYPVFITDTREASRGSVTLKVDTLGAYNELRSIVFPASGRIRPIIFNAGGDSTMLLNDLRVIPLDVNIEQITHADSDLRYVHIDYIETDPTVPLVHRSGDNDDLTTAPDAHFTISDRSPRRGQRVKLTDTSTGLFDSWDWTIGRNTGNKVGKFYGPGPYWVSWSSRGEKSIKLRVYGAGQGADVITKTLTVH